LVQELLALEEKTIQGLHYVKGACESFWSLKAKIDLAIFRENKTEAKT